MIFIGNGISPKMFFQKNWLIMGTELTQQQFYEEIKDKQEEIVNCMGHKTKHLKRNRINIQLVEGDTIYVIQYTRKRKRKSPRPHHKKITRIDILSTNKNIKRREYNMSKLSKAEMQHMIFEEEKERIYEEKRWDPEEGEFLIGELVEIKENVGYDNYTFYIIDDGEQKWSILQSSVLKSKFSNVEVGTVIKLTYLGFKKAEKGNRQYRNYSLQKAVATA